MKLSQPVTQGGQTFLHKMRMWGQIVRLAFFLSCMVSLLVFAGLCWKNFKVGHWHWFARIQQARLYDYVSGPKTVWQGRITVGQYLRHPRQQYFIRWMERGLIRYLLIALIAGGLIYILVFIYWQRQGRKTQEKTILSGGSFASLKQVVKAIHAKKEASNISLGALPLIKGSETQHMLITGTTGSGKTNTFHHLFRQLRDQKLVVLDTTGEFVERYYQEETDIILNPFDKRCHNWDLWGENEVAYHYDELAESLIPQQGHDPFWAQSARTLLAEILKCLKKDDHTRIQDILETATMLSLEDLYATLKNTKAAALIDPQSEKTATSIRMNLASNIACLEHLQSTCGPPFSIRQWMHNEKQTGWLFLHMTPAQRSTLRPIVSAWVSIAIKSLMECPIDPHRRVWFMIDELPSLHKLPDLPLCLSEGRKYGGCMVLGVQNIPQLDAIYGGNVSQSILDLCSTKVIFRSASNAMAQKLSYMLGTAERMEVQEGISYGANDTRDGVSLQRHITEKPVIPAHDLLNLPDLVSYVQLPHGYPITKLSWEIA